VCVVQVDHQGGNRLTEWRTGFQPGRRGRAHPLTAAGAATPEQAYLRHVRLDRRQLDAFVDLLRWSARSPEMPHFGQAVNLASNTRSGFGCSVRPNPGRPLRGGFSPMGRSGFCPFDGGSEELSGVLAGRSNLARRFSSSPIRASAASNRSTSDRMSSSFPAWLSVLRSCVTQSLNRAARDRDRRFLRSVRSGFPIHDEIDLCRMLDESDDVVTLCPPWSTTA
jgi:hypothetical protein